MKKIVNIGIFVLLLFCLSSCGVYSDQAKNKSGDDNGIIQDDVSSLDNKIESTETTTEWINPYMENYKEVSKQNVDIFLQNMAEWDTTFLADAIYLLEYYEQCDIEACIAIVTLTDVADESYIEEHGRRTEVNLRIEQLLEHNGVGNSYNDGIDIKTNDSVIWSVCEDGTYDIDVNPRSVPFAEVGSKYIVFLTYNQHGEADACALSLPFIGDGAYTETVAVGNTQHKYMSAETLWYYDINPSYYYEIWANDVETKKQFEDMGVDVLDKSYIQWQIENN